MSEETTPTREDTVKTNYEAAEAQYGEENYMRILMVILKDIDESLAMLVDAGSST